MREGNLKDVGVLVSKLLDLKVVELVPSCRRHLAILLAADHCPVQQEWLLEITSHIRQGAEKRK